MLPNLKGLTLIDGPSSFGGRVLAAIGNQLEYLAVNNLYQAGRVESDFGNLKQLRMFDDCYFEIGNEILSTAQNLEKAEIQLRPYNESLNAQRLNLIEKVLGQHEKLDYLEVRYQQSIERVLDAISSGLGRAIKYMRKRS